ncbi:hypothetical protein ACLB2K_005956 [Fragaria x ananassa]
MKVASYPVKNAKLSDICIGTSAAPTYFPAYYFENHQQGETNKFNLIDGGVAANNPALVAITEVTKQIMRKNPDVSEVQPLELYERFLLITLGTGSNKSELKYSAKMASKWGILSWLYDEGSTPLVTCYNEASSDMVAYHNCAVFEALQSENNYLRIDEDTLTGDLSSVDKATKENLENLVEVGEQLLMKQVSRMNLDTGLYEPVENGGTNEVALQRFAKLLSDEKKYRESKSPRPKAK